MKELYILLFLGVAMVLIFCTLSIGKIHKPLSKYAQRLLNVSIIAVLARAVTLIAVSEAYVSFGFSVFFSTIDWMLLFLIDFCFIYTNGKKSDVAYSILTGVVAFDSISILANNFTDNVFTCYPIITDSGEFYFRVNHGWYFNFHLTLCYSMLFFVAYELIKGIIHTGKLCRSKYIPILVCLVIIVVWNAVYMIFERKIDTSVLGYGVLGLVMNYFAIMHEPKDSSEDENKSIC
ncbi:MAG: hypothetical protein K6A23_06235 [Butyrivibrio sp.]|nr:hypothetical protein [Butyrivibrio sp.]